MSPRTRSPIAHESGFPRVSGDEPDDDPASMDDTPFSPREWGWAALRRSSHGKLLVFLA